MQLAKYLIWSLNEALKFNTTLVHNPFYDLKILHISYQHGHTISHGNLNILLIKPAPGNCYSHNHNSAENVSIPCYPYITD